jgi:heme-degrading monooxygenase HmoA
MPPLFSIIGLDMSVTKIVLLRCLYVKILEILLCTSIPQSFMFVVAAEIQIKKGSEDQFKTWIKESNQELSKFDGFVRRRLLETRACKHIILVEFETQKQFEDMHKTQEHFRIQSKGHSYLESPPKPTFYEVASQ